MNAITQTTALAIIAPSEISMLLAADQTDILGKLKAELDGYMPDASTPAGRTEANAKAKKIGAAKMDFKRLSETLTEGAKATIKGVRDEFAIIEARCDEMRDWVLAQNEAYKQIEQERVAGHEAALAELLVSPEFYRADLPVGDFAARLEWLRNRPTRQWQEFQARAEHIIADQIAQAETALAAAIKREAEAAELAQIRAAQAERARLDAIREQQEREAKIAAEAAERARVAAEEAATRAAEAEAKRAQAAIEAAQEAARVAEANRIAAEAKAEADRIAAAEKAARDQAAAIQAAERQAARVEAARVAAAEKAKRDQAAAIEAERARVKAAEKAAAKAAADRAANVAHKGQIMRAAKEALMTQIDLSEDQAREIVKAIVGGLIPHTKMEF